MKKYLTFLFIGFCLVGLVFLNGCKSEEEIVYDIRGLWTLNYYWSAVDAPPPGTTTITFTGSLTSGTFVTGDGYDGTYAVSDMAVQWTFTMGTVYTGNFTTQTTMSGTMRQTYGNTGTWNATR